MESSSDEQRIQVLHAAVEGLDLLVKGLRRRQGNQCKLCEYAPDVVRYHVFHFTELRTATEGVSAAGANVIGGGVRDRMKLAAILADIEAATDEALAPLLRWRSVARIYKRESRFDHYLDLRQHSLLNLHNPEPSQPLAEAICIEAISLNLGWRPHDLCVVR